MEERNSMEELVKLSEVDIRTVSRDELIDITSLPKEETDCEGKDIQMKKFIEQVKNPYCFMVGDMIVKSSFTEGVSLQQRIQELAAGL